MIVSIGLMSMMWVLSNSVNTTWYDDIFVMCSTLIKHHRYRAFIAIMITCVIIIHKMVLNPF